MQKIIPLLFAGVLAITSSCNKPEAVFFEDKSTAIKADKSGWTATADSETPDDWENTGKASAVIDGDISTYWHTDYSIDPVPGYPHWVLLDMKSANHLIGIAITNRQAASPNKAGMKKFRLEGSNDGNSFTSLGEFNFAITNDAQRYPLSPDIAYRYLKLTALESQTGKTPHTFLAEIDVFTTK